MEFLILQVEINEGGDIDGWSTWSPVAQIDAETGPKAIDVLADDPGKVADAQVYVAVPLSALTVRMTTIHRHARVHDATADLATLAPELREREAVDA